MNNDRGIIKWAPFNSLNQKEMINNLLKERQKTKKPILSLEQQKELEEKIIEAFYDQTKIKIFYFKNGYILNTITKIIKIDHTFKKIYLSNHTFLIFTQILKINVL